MVPPPAPAQPSCQTLFTNTSARLLLFLVTHDCHFFLSLRGHGTFRTWRKWCLTDNTWQYAIVFKIYAGVSPTNVSNLDREEFGANLLKLMFSRRRWSGVEGGSGARSLAGEERMESRDASPSKDKAAASILCICLFQLWKIANCWLRLAWSILFSHSQGKCCLSLWTSVVGVSPAQTTLTCAKLISICNDLNRRGYLRSPTVPSTFSPHPDNDKTTLLSLTEDIMLHVKSLWLNKLRTSLPVELQTNLHEVWSCIIRENQFIA